MRINFQPDTMHTNRILNVVLAVQPVILSKDLNNFAVRRQLNNGSRLFDTHTIFLCNLAVSSADCNHAFGVAAAHVRAVHIDRSLANTHTGNAFRLCDSLDDSFCSIFNMHDNTLAHTEIRRTPMADNSKSASVILLKHSDDATNGAGADIETNVTSRSWIAHAGSIALILALRQVDTISH